MPSKWMTTTSLQTEKISWLLALNPNRSYDTSYLWVKRNGRGHSPIAALLPLDDGLCAMRPYHDCKISWCIQEEHRLLSTSLLKRSHVESVSSICECSLISLFWRLYLFESRRRPWGFSSRGRRIWRFLWTFLSFSFYSGLYNTWWGRASVRLGEEI